MSTLDKARATQLKNIETKTGKDLAELTRSSKIPACRNMVRYANT